MFNLSTPKSPIFKFYVKDYTYTMPDPKQRGRKRGGRGGRRPPPPPVWGGGGGGGGLSFLLNFEEGGLDRISVFREQVAVDLFKGVPVFT